ncbi:hypothetical protein CROQUDRAFT_88162 [Cronartium quercuum f. sp. fusiforme G11]|uniref:Reverse transcriptase n=1 Tax=Cronartium quercuum f. sp. fusiforme G11 TaxID=708437 RepID=A0A9P6NVL8_9BASI|nr:hypothetical protein CROQUDRAFT_88162 [Cronartium quercuum f. sp. fusiforme G11]
MLLPPPSTHNSAKITNLNHSVFVQAIETRLPPDSLQLLTETEIDLSIVAMSNAILDSFHAQGKEVKSRPSWYKAWWDPERLNPILKNWNRAHRWWLHSHTTQAHSCFIAWQEFFRNEVQRTKSGHWKRFLAKSQGTDTFKAYKYTKPASTGEIAPLYRSDRSLATDREEQARLLFEGTSMIHTEADLLDIGPPPDPHIDPGLDAVPITHFELGKVIHALPNKKVKGHGGLFNKLIKAGYPALQGHLLDLFNTCIKIGYFPHSWRIAITAIIRKAGKSNYSESGSYRPIALLNCLGKQMAIWEADAREALKMPCLS